MERRGNLIEGILRLDVSGASQEKQTKTYAKSVQRVNDFSDGNMIYITKANYMHTDGCEPSVQQLIFTSRAGGN